MANDTSNAQTPTIFDATPRPWRLLIALSASLVVLLAAVAWVGMLGWALGEIVSDRYAWSQWLEWIPTIFTLIGALVCLGSASVAAALRNALRSAGTVAGSTAENKPGLASRLLLRTGWLAWVIVLVYFVISETPFYKPKPEPPAFNQGSFRLVYWNSGGEEKPGWDRAIGALNPDILVLNGLQSSAGTPSLQALIAANASVIVNERFVIISKRTIVQWGATSLALPKGDGLDPRQTSGHRPWIDRGRALFFQFLCPTGNPDIQAESPPVLRTAWVIDLPSDLSLTRAELTARANEVITTFPNRPYVRDSRGAWVPEAVRPTTPGFPRPDIITGDFNIPRGAWSLDVITAHLEGGSDAHRDARSRNAYHQAARRFCASWPRPSPFLHLDQTFVGPSMRAWSYFLKDPGSAEHLIQTVDITDR